MKQTIYIKGITCESCVLNIKNLFKEKFNISDIKIDIQSWKLDYSNEFLITKDQISEIFIKTKYSLIQSEWNKLWKNEKVSFKTYIPLFTLFAYITILSLLVEYSALNFNFMRFMQHFMAWFFISFSYFKIINLKEFSISYSMYDILAKKWKKWWYIYAFVELWLWISYFAWFFPLIINILTFLIMSISIIWVIQSVMKKQKIKCACLGAVFNLPMSTITIIEDGIMIIMSLSMIILLLS